MNWRNSSMNTLAGLLVCAALGCVSLGQIAVAADWPQFRHDAARSGESNENLAGDLHLQWIRELPPPRPAFPTEVRLRFDASYEPVVMGKQMFVPSMVADSVTALDTDSGAVRWTFFAEGPIRFAPVARQGKVYAASDDGFLYCLNAADGKLLWRFRGLPADQADRKLLGNGRLISLWPARGGPVLQDGVVYFAAGLWPDDGVYVHALNAESGQSIWSNTTSNRIPRANMDHGVAQYAGLTPQGYLACNDSQLVVPCGAQLPAFLDVKTGALGDYNMGWGGRVGLPKGSWLAATAGKLLSSSGDIYDVSRPNDEKFRNSRGREDFKGQLYPGGFTRLQIDPTNQRALGQFREPVLSAEAMYYNDARSGVAAFDLTDYELVERTTLEPAEYRKADQYPDKWAAKFPQRWNLPSKLRVHIKAGPRLYLGGPGVVQAVDIPAEGQQPEISWERAIEGTPHRMLAADGKLFVVTLAGRIYAFGAQQTENVAVQRPPKLDRAPEPQSLHRAQEIIDATDAAEGYAVLLGARDAGLIEALLQQSELQVIVIDTDASKIDALRKYFHASGDYGTRVTALVGDPTSYPLPPFMANLVLSPRWQVSANAAEHNVIRSVFRLLQPYGGVALTEVGAADSADALKRLKSLEPNGATISKLDGSILLHRQGGLPTAADWSHAGADAANTGASQDQFLKAPLGLLWFDSSLRWHRKPGSAVIRVAGGRIFVKADRLHAIDAYTGRRLWQQRLPIPAKRAVEMVAAADAIYFGHGQSLLVLNPANGEVTSTIDLPQNISGSWANLRVSQHHVAGTVGRELVCVSRTSGKVVWQYECARARLSTAIGGGKVFCAEVLDTRRGENQAKAGTKLRGFDIQTGQLLWEVDNGAAVRYSEAHDLVVTTSGIFSGKDGARVRAGAPPAQIAGEKLISGNSDNFVVYDLTSGAQSGQAIHWVRRGCTGLRSSCHIVTTRFKGNAAYMDLAAREITPLWNIRPGCNNNLFPANGILNVPNVTGGCECNYTPTSKAFAPLATIRLPLADE